MYIVTITAPVKYVPMSERGPDKKVPKVTGKCPVTDTECTDTHGRHHSVLVEAQSVLHAKLSFASDIHITRIEEVSL